MQRCQTIQSRCRSGNIEIGLQALQASMSKLSARSDQCNRKMRRARMHEGSQGLEDRHLFEVVDRHSLAGDRFTPVGFSYTRSITVSAIYSITKGYDANAL